MMQKTISVCLLILAAPCFINTVAAAQETDIGQDLPEGTDTLLEEFQSPPRSARPRVWWHWMNGNVSMNGIEKDLEWMSRIGIGGVQNFDAGLGTPQIVDHRLAYMTPEWRDAFRHAVQIAARENLEFAIAASPGWSQTGGPWVQPQDGMKRISWSETVLTGGQRFAAHLPAFPTNAGAYQTVALRDRRGRIVPADDQPETASGSIAVFALPVQATALPVPLVADHTHAPLDGVLLQDVSLESHVILPANNGEEPGTLTLRYPHPVNVQSARLFIHAAQHKWRDPMYAPSLQADIGGNWQEVATLAVSDVPMTTAFAPVTASDFRIVFHPVADANVMNLGDGVPGADRSGRLPAPHPDSLAIGDLRLLSEARIDRVEQKANFTVGREFYPIWDSSLTPGHALADRIDLTDRVRADGFLDWTPPAGRDWRVFRVGWAITGERNHPASPEATGLEVDKFDAAAVREYLETYLGMYRAAVGPELMGSSGLSAILTDSIEVGGSNWTGEMFAEFENRRGYDLRPWLPALLGQVMVSPDASERFLYDFRQTLSELMTDAHYRTVAEVAHENGMTVYGEALEGARASLGDDLAMRSHADIPMAAMWMFNPEENPRSPLVGDIIGAASVANIYGQNIVAAESLTAILAPWGHAPADMKRVLDYEFALGVNRPVIHTSVHQPSDAHVPGLSLGTVGQYFNRHDTWAEMAGPFVDYIARSSYLLQQGRAVSDIAYFYGEETPIVQQFAERIPQDLPQRFGFDFVSADILAERLTVENGELVARTPGLARYQALYLGGTSDQMTLATLERIAALAEAGALVIGEKPSGSPNLLDDQDAFRRLADKLWAGGSVTRIGDGRIVRGEVAEQTLRELGRAFDFFYTGAEPDNEILFRHRQWDDGDVYFVTNRRSHREEVEAYFRVTGRSPEIWDAVTGRITPSSFRVEGEHTIVPLDLSGHESLFVVFREPTQAVSRDLGAMTYELFAELDQDWDVTFQPERGAPEGMAMPRLAPLNESTRDGVRFFSGVATYNSEFFVAEGEAANTPIWLDLGAVGDVAQVEINGIEAGVVWSTPYRLDISRHLRNGRNSIVIKVANLWRNRLIGDVQPDVEPVAFTTVATYTADAELRPSGLIGPVRLFREISANGYDDTVRSGP